MCSVAVDFAKHGECVSKKNYAEFKKEIERLPDFMEKETMRTYESDGVLGHLYRDISKDNALLQFMHNDWKNSICLQYSLDENILGLCSDRHLMHSYLEQVYTIIVLPMGTLLKKIMIYF